MITVTFTANNLFALRDDIVKFLEDAGFEAQKITKALSEGVSEIHEREFSPESLETVEVELIETPNGLRGTGGPTGLLNTVTNDGIALTNMPHPGSIPLAPAPIVEEQAPIPEETQTEQPTASVSDASPPLTFEEVRLATLQLASKRGREAVMEVLAPYNVKRSSEVSEDLWPELIAKLEAAQNV